MNEISIISDISNEEYVQLVSTYWFLMDENYNCFKCKKAASPSVRDSRKACFTPRMTEIVNYNNQIKYLTCPSNHFNIGMSRLIDMFRLFQTGILPYNGGILDQPSKIIELFRIIENLEIERQIELNRKLKWQKTQSKSNSRLKNKKP